MAETGQLRIAIIGAGITSITTAYNLVKRGCRVSVFDRQPYPAMETSYANGGQLSASNAEVWNSWATVRKGLKWIFTPGAPLLINPRPSWHKISWLTEFITSIGRYEQNTIQTARLAVEARSHLMRIAADEQIEFDRQDRAILHFYETKAEFEDAARITELLARGGVERRAVTPGEIRSIEPRLHGKFYGGFYTPADFTGDIHKFTGGLAKACERLGVSLRLNSEVAGVHASDQAVVIQSRGIEATSHHDQFTTISEEFDRLIVCGGVSSRQIARLVGDRVNVYPVKGYSITVNLLDEIDQEAAPWTGLLDDKAKIVTSRLGATRFRIAGTAEFNGMNKDIRASRIEPLIAWCRLRFPGLSTRQIVPWAGLRPMMPDMMPRVMRGKCPRVLYNTGHGHLGWTLSAATAEAVSALAVAQSDSG